MKKITALSEVSNFSKNARKKGKTVGLVVGSFDILHLGHTNLFRFAKKHSDVLIVGLDNDQTIRLVKGDKRPVNTYKRRAELLSDLETIDRVFEIKTAFHHDSEEALDYYEKLVLKISPTHIFTHKVCDKHWKKKEKIAKKNNIKFLIDRSPKITNSGTILRILLNEY